MLTMNCMNKFSFTQLAAAVGMAALSLGAFVAQALPVQIPGFLKFESYPGITGTAVQMLLDAPIYPDSPAQTLYMTSFNTRTVYPDDTHENFGGRITGFLIPAESAEYELFLRSDDASQLFISSNDDPAGLELVAQEAGCCGAFEETGAPETAPSRLLEAGQRYAIQVLYKEGGGGDYAQVAWRQVGDTTPASLLQPIPSAFISTLIEAAGSIAITLQPPATRTAARNDVITLNVGFTATFGPAIVQWQRNGLNVPGLTGATVDYGPLSAEDNGAKFRAVISIPGATATSTETTLTVTPDVTKPTIKSVLGNDRFDMLTVVFSEAVDPSTSELIGSYSLNGGLSVLEVLVLSPTSVKLTTSPQSVGTTYILTILGIVDTAGNVSAPGTSKTFSSLSRIAGGLKFEAYFGIGGTAIATLLSDPDYPDNPDQIGYVTKFTSRLIFPDASHENYGGRMSGWLVPAETDDYEFFIRSDDASQLSLSIDEDPLNGVVIASEAGCCGPFEPPGAPETSTPVTLTAGERYYIEALWKEGGGGDYCDVAWRKVGDPAPPIGLPYIPGTRLETYALPGTFTPPTAAISSPANGATFDAGAAVTLTATATAAGEKTIVRVEFLEQGKKLGETTRSPYSITLFDLSSDTHNLIARATDSAGLFVDSTPITISLGAEVERIVLLAIDEVTKFRYDRSGVDLGTEWREAGYDDSAWPEGKTLIADEGTTTVEPIRTRVSRFNDQGQYVKTFYYRTHFNFSRAVSPNVKLKLRHVVDDGVAIYLHGVEIHRFGLGTADIVFSTDAAGHENIYEGPFDMPVDNLLEGDNVLAAEVHQAGGGSSDMVFGAELIATVPVVRASLTVVGINDTTMFRYDRRGIDLGSEWREPAYDDSAWPEGATLIADEGTTTVEPIRTRISRFNDQGQYVKTFYFRTHFNFSATTKGRAKVKLRHAVDDGAAFYLNGVEIHRFGLGTGDIVFSTDAAGHENIYEGPFEIPIDNLLLGDNVLAAEVHQAGGGSSDMVFGGELTINVPVSDLVAQGTVLTATRVGASISLAWAPGGGKLESATSVSGPWSEVVGATNPQLVTTSQKARFYRVHK